MIKLFLKFLEEQSVAYRITNGYEHIVDNVKNDGDHDILFAKNTFKKIDSVISEFSITHGFKLVQKYHQGEYAKNFIIWI